MCSTSPVQFAVVTADVVGSRQIDSFVEVRDRKLQVISDLHGANGLVQSPYAVTAWDEFQVIASAPERIPRILFDLRRMFAPMELRIGVGMGSATGTGQFPINLYAGGPAFERAREAANRLRVKSPKFRLLTSFESGNADFDIIANTVYRLQDALLEGITPRQWETINLQVDSTGLAQTAERQDVDISTVSRSLSRAYYWHLVDTRDAMEQVIKKHLQLV